MKKFILISISVFTLATFVSNAGYAQMIDNSEGNAFTEMPFFSKRFIAENKIREIKGHLQTKKEGDQIRDKKTDIIYRFDTLGRMIEYVRVYPKGKVQDSSKIIYSYQEGGQIASLEKHDGKAQKQYVYEHDSTGRLTKEVLYSTDYDMPDRWIKVKEETYQHQKLDGSQSKTLTYNHLGKVYKEEVSNKNKFGYLTEVSGRYLISNRKSKRMFEYNELGYVSEKIEFTQNLKNQQSYTYDYDEYGNLVKITLVKNNNKVNHQEFLYTNQNLLQASIKNNPNSKMISITKFFYQFYN